MLFTVPSSSHNIPVTVVLPDLVSPCTFTLRFNRHAKHASAASKKWLFCGDNLSATTRRDFHGLKCGLLASMCYPDVAYPQLRVACDFMTYLFHLDDLSDDMDTLGTRSIADVIMNTLHHPFIPRAASRLGTLAKE